MHSIDWGAAFSPRKVVSMARVIHLARPRVVFETPGRARLPTEGRPLPLRKPARARSVDPVDTPNGEAAGGYPTTPWLACGLR